jgi:hypothetical protein
MKTLRFGGWLFSHLQVEMPVLLGEIEGVNPNCLISKMLIRPVVTYGAEYWVLTKKDKLQLAFFERKVLIKIFGPIRDTDQWRRRHNEEMYQLYAEPEIVK